jgi:hypothetical protein
MNPIASPVPASENDVLSLPPGGGDSPGTRPTRDFWSWVASTLALSSLLVLVFCGWVWYRYGSLTAAEAHLIRRNALFAEPLTSAPVAVRAGETAEIGFRLRNLGRQPLLVYGLQTSCSCVAVSGGETPFTLPELGARQVIFRVQTDKSEAGQTVERMVVFYGESPGGAIGVPLRIRVL